MGEQTIVRLPFKSSDIRLRATGYRHIEGIRWKNHHRRWIIEGGNSKIRSTDIERTSTEYLD